MTKKLLLLIFIVIFCFCTGCAINPLTGEEELMLIGEHQDVEIGRQYAPEAEKQMGGRIENERLQNYLNSIGQSLSRVSHRPGLEYHFVAVKDKSINAFTLPGGYIFIAKGMLENLDSEAQLAAILAHEISHVVARDHAAAMSREIGIGIVLAAVTPDKTPEGAMVAADIARQLLGLKYNRDDEEQADLAGLDYMVWAGYNPHGMVETMQMLERQNKLRTVEFFSTHPAVQNRMQYMTDKIQRKYHDVTGLKIGREDYHGYVLEHLKD
jgi:predicted Zn-dependent protease